MFCCNCGHKLKSDYNFCPACGRKTEHHPPITTEPPPMLECRVWFQCPKCGIRFESHGKDLSDIKFGTCMRCGYKKEIRLGNQNIPLGEFIAGYPLSSTIDIDNNDVMYIAATKQVEY